MYIYLTPNNEEDGFSIDVMRDDKRVGVGLQDGEAIVVDSLQELRLLRETPQCFDVSLLRSELGFEPLRIEEIRVPPLSLLLVFFPPAAAVLSSLFLQLPLALLLALRPLLLLFFPSAPAPALLVLFFDSLLMMISCNTNFRINP